MKDVTRIVLDNEAVQALRDVRHRKHQLVVSLIQVAARLGPRRQRVAPVLPTAVRVEAGWSRRPASAAALNRLRVDDVPLDVPTTDRAAAIVSALGVSVADAHIGAVIAAVGPCTVLTSDVDDMTRIAAHLDVPVTVVAL